MFSHRWYYAHDVTPLYSFGHGLSYTTFEYDKLTVIPHKVSEVTPQSVVATVRFTVKNTGKFDGDEVPQMYIKYPAHAFEPPRQLRNFVKVSTKVGETKTVQFDLTAKDCSIWDTNAHDWQLVAGQFEVMVGASSSDVRQSSSLVLLA